MCVCVRERGTHKHGVRREVAGMCGKWGHQHTVMPLSGNHCSTRFAESEWARQAEAIMANRTRVKNSAWWVGACMGA